MQRQKLYNFCLLFCLLEKDKEFEFNEKQLKSLNQVAKMVESNGGHIFFNLKDVANYVNERL